MNNSFESALRSVAGSRFFCFSLLVHVVLVLLAGSAVIFKVAHEAPDFEAGAEGIVTDAPEKELPPAATTSQAAPEFNQTVPVAPSIPVQVIVTNNPAAPLNVVPLGENTLRRISNLMAVTDAAARRAGAAGGTAGGTKMGMIFGKKVMARKLGVILDVSGSAQPHIAPAMQEIEKSFADSISILYPGCGMIDLKGPPLHQMRLLAAVKDTELDPSAPPRSTPGQLVKALKIPEFEKVVHSPGLHDRLFVSWYLPDGSGANQLVSQTQLAFDDLISKGVDSIFWYSDFKDKVEPGASAALLERLKARKVRVYLHNFADDIFPAEVLKLAEETGGTADPAKPK